VSSQKSTCRCGVNKMPRFKKGTKEFEMNIFLSGNQYKMTVPKMLLERLNEAVKIMGTFSIIKGKLVLREESRIVTPEQLCGKWWPLPEFVTKEQAQEWDWDDLMSAIGIFNVTQPITELDKLNISPHVHISDWDIDTYDRVHVTFEEY